MHIFRQITINDEALTRFPFRRELSMQAYVLERPKILKLDGKYDGVEIYEEEITIKGDRTKAGRIDMIATYSGEHIAIIEFKNVELVQKHLDQLEGYLKNKEKLQTLDPPILSEDRIKKPKWIGILIGTSINPDFAHKIANGYSYKNIPIAAITIERFRSETGNAYITTDTYFKSKSNSRRDFTQYEFNGELYGKGRLVLAVVQAHVKRHPKITYNKLLKSFPKDKVGDIVFEKLKIVEEKNKGKTTKRHFIEANELIKLDDGTTIAVSTEWGKDNIKGFIKRAKELTHKIY